jgi:hypothetical protein
VQKDATAVDKSSSEPDIDGARRAQSIDPLQARVDGAAFALLREGRNPTVSLVRARMGGGSPNVVAPALQRWRLSFAGQLDENAGSALEVLPPGVLELVQALWSRALFEAHRVRADARSTADALEQLNEAIQDLRNRAARLAKREAALDAELRDLKKQRRRSTKAHSTRRRLKPKAIARPVATVPLKPKRSEPTATQPGKHRGHVARTAHKPLSRARRAAPRR